MNRNKVADNRSRHRQIVALFGALALLLVLLAACNSQQVSEEAVQTAIAQTSTAQAENQSAFGTAVADAVATQVSAMVADAPQATPVPATPTEPEASSDASASEMTDEQCEEACEELRNQVQDLADELTAVWEEIEESGPGGGGPAEEAACDRGDFDACAKNTSGENVIVRTGPGLIWPPDRSVTVLLPGDRVPVICEVQTGWLNIMWSVELNRDGWVAEEFMTVEGSPDICTEIPPTPFPTATPSPTPTATTPSPTPEPEITLTASRTRLTVGQTSELTWRVKNVQAAYLYPVGADWRDYPVTGEGTQEVRPYITTTYQLRVLKTDGTTEYSEVEIEVNAGLTDGIWRLKSYENTSGALVSVIAGSDVNARFGLFGRVDGSGGCNTYTGDYEAYDETLQIFLINATSSTCADDIMQQESAFFQAMRRAASMTIIANDLTVQDSLGRTILTFAR